LKLAVQPYITLLELRWDLDQFSLALKRRQQALRSQASNAVESPSEKATRKVPPPKRDRVFVAVHRLDNDLYYKRLEEPAYRLLVALRDGQTLAAACESAITGDEDSDWANKIRQWFTEWTQMGWFCKR
jgi:hypothetical protein